MADGQRILAFGRYTYAEGVSNSSLRPCVRIDFVARDLKANPGIGMDLMIRLLVRIAVDPRAAAYKGVLIDAMNCGNPEACVRRWRFFTELIGFRPLQNNSQPWGYAFLRMDLVREIAARADA